MGGVNHSNKSIASFSLFPPNPIVVLLLYALSKHQIRHSHNTTKNPDSPLLSLKMPDTDLRKPDKLSNGGWLVGWLELFKALCQIKDFHWKKKTFVSDGTSFQLPQDFQRSSSEKKDADKIGVEFLCFMREILEEVSQLLLLP